MLPDGLFADIDRSSPIPLYYQVAVRVEDAIRSGAIAPGTRLEGELVLAERLGVSRPTVRQALRHVADKGLVVRHRGVGTIVVDPSTRGT